jgi:hypothetical protein
MVFLYFLLFWHGLYFWAIRFYYEFNYVFGIVVVGFLVI